MPGADRSNPDISWVHRMREKVETHPVMKPGRLSSIGQELAYAIEDIRHKVVEEGWFGRQVTPSTFPREDPPAPGIHGSTQGGSEPGPDIHGNGGGGSLVRRGLEGQVLGPEGPPPLTPLPAPEGPRPVVIDVEPAEWKSREAARLEYLGHCRDVANSHGPDDPGPDRSRQIAGPER